MAGCIVWPILCHVAETVSVETRRREAAAPNAFEPLPFKPRLTSDASASHAHPKRTGLDCKLLGTELGQASQSPRQRSRLLTGAHSGFSDNPTL